MSVPTPDTIAVGGATVGYYTYGSPDGDPVLVFHGTPACGAGFAWADQAAASRGLRLIAPDRPGVGVSSRAPGWTVGSYPTMVAEFVDAMGIDAFAVWGYSGGGPYAVATAAKLAGRVTAAAVTAGMGQIPAWASVDEFEKTDRQFLVMATKRPWLARALLGTIGRLARLAPASAMRSFEKQLSTADRAVIGTLGTPREAMALFTQAFLRGSAGVVDDYAALAKPWDVDLAAIECPLLVAHATADQMVPLSHSLALAERVGSATMVTWPDEGHLATVTHVGEILDALRRT
jgi:pimeloyl-ACP methyl ester carboxylesterase